MQINKDKGNLTASSVIKAMSLVALLVAIGYGLVLFKADITGISLMAFFMLFYVIVPGMYLITKLDLKGEYTSTFLARSFFSGFALNVILYFVSELISSDVLLYAAGPVLTVLYFISIARKKTDFNFDKCQSVFSSIPASFYLFFAIAFITSTLITQYTYISPEYVDYSNIKIDFAYHAGIINALSQGFPPQDPWISGVVIEYHYLTEMLYSIPVRLFGLPSELILMSCTPYIITPVFTISLYAFFREFSKIKENAGIYCLALNFSNMFMIKEFTHSWFLYHIYSNINNAGMGISCLLTTLPLLKYWDKGADAEKKSNTKHMLLFAILVMLTTGIKGPVSIVLTAALIGTVLLGAVLKQIDRGTIAVTGMAVIAFTVIYFYILGAQHSNEGGGRLINLWEVTDIFFLKQEITEAVHAPSVIGNTFALIAFCVFFFTAFLVPLLVGYLRELALVLSKKKPFEFSRVTIYAACLVGFAAMMIFDFSGHSQVYFGFVTCALVPVIAFWYFEDTKDSSHRLRRAVMLLFVAGLCITTITSLMYTEGRVAVARGYYAARNDNASKYRNVSSKEYEGLIWIKHNTKKDALIASDRYNSVPMDEYDVGDRGHNTHFMYAVYSNRRQYIEGSGFSIEDKDTPKRIEKIENNSELYLKDNSERGELARSLGIDYVIVSKRFNNPGDLSNEDYSLCFTNDEMDIYELKD